MVNGEAGEADSGWDRKVFSEVGIGNGWWRTQEMLVFCVFFMTMVGLMWVKFLLAGLGGLFGEEVCYISGGEGL